MRDTKGITLMTLIITIIVLIILAGVTIAALSGENGLLTKAREAKKETAKQAATEIINLKITVAQMKSYTEKQLMPTLKELSLELKEDDEIAYVTEVSKIASTEYNVPSENPSSIYTKLNDYPYEFEINNSLQLASINGVQIENVDNNEELENLRKEFKDYKRFIAETLKENGAEALEEDSKEIIKENIGKIANENFLKGISSKFVKVSENVSSRYEQTIDITGIENYRNFTIDNFVIVLRGLTYEANVEKQNILTMSKEYNSENGKLKLGALKSYDGTWSFWNTYDVYVFTK